jgi:ribosomal protein L11 methyltransferase
LKTFLEVSVSANNDQRELLLPTMIEYGCAGVEETDTHLIAFFDEEQLGAKVLDQFKTDLYAVLRTISVNAEIVIRRVEDRNWNEEWEKTIKPIEIGSRFVVKPSWCTYENREHRIVLTIDPKMSFGTGYHETTRLVLCLLEELSVADATVLDVGTGTGILAIAAAQLGAKSVLGIDIDEWSIDNAIENAKANGVHESVTICGSPLESIDLQNIDLIMANLTLNTNVGYLSLFKKALRHGGNLLLSGLLSVDEPEMTKRLFEGGFSIGRIERENEWIAIAAISAS